MRIARAAYIETIAMTITLTVLVSTTRGRCGMNNEEAIKLLQSIEEDGWNVFGEHIEALDLAIKALEEKPQGEWIKRHKQNSFGQDVVCFECSRCGEFKVPLYHLMITKPLEVCPNCGADMRKPNCVTCDHFGDCDGCERSGEE